MKKEIVIALNDEIKDYNDTFSTLKQIGKGLLVSIIVGILIGLISQAEVGFAFFLIVFLFYLIKAITRLAKANSRHLKGRKENINIILAEAGKTVEKSIKQILKD